MTKPRLRKQFATKGEALAFEAFVLDPGKGKPRREEKTIGGDERWLTDLVLRWFGLHGQSLSDGERRRSKLLLLCESLGNLRAVFNELKRLRGQANSLDGLWWLVAKMLSPLGSMT